MPLRPPSGFTSVGHRTAQRGFTLIELSIVLVIIGLIIGGVVVGQDLVKAATLRSQITQLEKYKTAVNTFRGKYGYLPGDIPNPVASQFGFVVRGQYAGEGDGNGILEGIESDAADQNNGFSQDGENTLFWRDLSTAGLIDQPFSTAVATGYAGAMSQPLLNTYIPLAAIGRGNSLYTYSFNSINYFGISSVVQIYTGGGFNESGSQAGLTVMEAYTIDTKIDDGLPLTGNMITVYPFPPGMWYSMGGAWGGTYWDTVNITPPVSTTGSSLSCFDASISNDGQTLPSGFNAYFVGGSAYHYSLEINGGAGPNCAVTIHF